MAENSSSHRAAQAISKCDGETMSDLGLLGPPANAGLQPTRSAAFPPSELRYHGVAGRAAEPRTVSRHESNGVETREIIVGRSSRGALLLVCFVERTESVRLISARPATARERHDYEEAIR
jgi:uncharacterized DUF497 family protein